MEKKYLAFKIDQDLFLITIDNVYSIIQKKIEEIRSIAEAPSFVEGISSLRETALLIVNGPKLFNKKHLIKEEYIIVVLKDAEKTLGLIVDEVIVVMQVEENKIQTKNSFVYSSSMVNGVYLDKENIYLMLNPEKFFNLKTEN